MKQPKFKIGDKVQVENGVFKGSTFKVGIIKQEYYGYGFMYSAPSRFVGSEHFYHEDMLSLYTEPKKVTLYKHLFLGVFYKGRNIIKESCWTELNADEFKARSNSISYRDINNCEKILKTETKVVEYDN
jgi:hypothetical protein